MIRWGLVKSKASTKQKRSSSEKKIKVPGDELSAHSKDRLLQAALEVFARKGYHGATTKKIAAAAGVSESLIMRHFQTKLGLFLAVIEGKRIVPSAQDEPPYPAQDNLTDELLCFSDYLLEYARNNADMLRIIMGQSLLDAEFDAFLRPRLPRPYSEVLHKRLERLQKERKLSLKVDLPALQATVWNVNLSSALFSIMLKVIDDKMALSELRYAIKLIAAGAEAQEL